MTNIYESDLLNILPPNLRENSDVIASCKAIDGEFQLLASHIKNSIIFADIDNVSEKLLDYLAVELNTDFYENTLPVDAKRNLALDFVAKSSKFLVPNELVNKASRLIKSLLYKYSSNPARWNI